MKHRDIAIEFGPKPQGLSALQRLFVFGGLAALAIALLVAQHLRQQHQTLETTLSQRAERTAQAALVQPTHDPWRLHHQHHWALDAHWRALLSALDNAATDTVRLTKVDPDTTSGLVTIEAISRSLPSALAYVNQLRQSSLTAVALRVHDPVVNNPNRVKFVVTARWTNPPIAAVSAQSRI